MFSLGRYRLQYDQISRISAKPHEIPGIGEDDTDMAMAGFDKARVSCWTCAKDRQWGIHGPGRRHAAVMQFQIQADPGSEGCILREFKIDLAFSPVNNCGTGSYARSIPDASTELSEANAEVKLIGRPAPSRVSPETGTWRFWSDRIPDTSSGQALTARWVWESNDDQNLKGRVLYGALAIHHPGKPFEVRCHVRGRIATPGWLRLKFSDREHEPRTWKLRPQKGKEDLKARIDQLEEQMMMRNRPDSPCEHLYSQPFC